ncbi:unnamed protein product, partial [Polarella glacialis]
EKLQALQDLGFNAGDEDEDGQVALKLEFDFELPGGQASGVRSAAQRLADAMQVLVLTDLELCFWPPAASEAEAQDALKQLVPCSRRRALLAARRALGDS